MTALKENVFLTLVRFSHNLLTKEASAKVFIEGVNC